MRNIFYFIFIIVSLQMLTSCSVETETHVIQTPKLVLSASGPMFEGSNTATITWEYELDALIPKFNEETEINEVRISSIKINPINNFDYPNIGKMVMELKPGNQAMSRVGLLETNFDMTKSNSLTIADIQEDLNDGFEDGRLTFVADFDLKEEEYFDDIKFELEVTLEVKTKK